MPESDVFTLWFSLVGVIFIVMALSGSVLRRLPLTTAVLYLAAGAALSSVGFGLLRIHPVEHAEVLERVSEVAVIVSLFAAGLKLRMPFRHDRWKLPFRLAFLSVPITVVLIAVVGVAGLGLSVGAAILLGAILAPTDPVLASDVTVEDPADTDQLRFGLTGEAGLNDGVAFPFVMLGLGLLGAHEIGEFGWRWLAVDVIWSIPGGLAVGAITGTLVGKLVLYLRRTHKEAVGLDDFLTLGLIALSYGLALQLHTYGFLAVFAAGLALRRVERESSHSDQPALDVFRPGDVSSAEEIATDPDKAPAYLTGAVLGFNEQLERIGEVAIVIITGALLAAITGPIEAIWFVPVLFLIIRPVSTEIGAWGTRTTKVQRRLIDWFGIRGIGSIYYLAFAMTHGLAEDVSLRLSSLVLTVVAVSIVVHGISVTPLMNRYAAWHQRRRHANPDQPGAD